MKPLRLASVWQHVANRETNGSFCVVLREDGHRFGERLADHRRQFLRASAIDLREIDVLRVASSEAGHRGDDGVKVRFGIVVKDLRRLLRARQIPLHCMMHDPAKFLLAEIGFSPVFTLFRQEYIADQRSDFFVTTWHLLKRRIGIGKARRSRSAVLGAEGADLGVNAPADDVREDVVGREICRPPRRICWRSRSVGAASDPPSPSIRACRPRKLGAPFSVFAVTAIVLCVEGLDLPFAAADLLHADGLAEMLGELRERRVTLA